MPTEYECYKCGLNFTVGWYHYSRHAIDYGARTFLVCRCCGVIHSVEVSVRSDLQNRLQSQLNKYFYPNKTEGIQLYGEWGKDELIGDKKSDELTCQSCNQRGSLVKDWSEKNDVCPNCKKESTRKKTSWVT